MTSKKHRFLEGQVGVKKHRTPNYQMVVFWRAPRRSSSLGGHVVERSKETKRSDSSLSSRDPKVRESQKPRSSAAAGFLGIGTLTPGNGHDDRVPAIGHLFK